MTFLPHLTIHDGESLMSYAARVGHFHTGFSTYDFLHAFEISRSSVYEGNEYALQRLAPLTGTGVERLREATYQVIGNRCYSHRSERFHAEFAGRERTTFCPACLLADRDHSRGSMGRRVGKIEWMFSPVRTCPEHCIPLVRFATDTCEAKFLDMELRAPDDHELAKMQEALQVMKRSVSPLQNYISDRFSGREGPAWLDNQQIDYAARACEMIGAIVLHDASVQVKYFTEDDWDAAGRAGFPYVARGEPGVRDALSIVFNRFIDKGEKGRPQKALGALFKWLQHSKNEKPVGPIRGVVREFILDHFAISSGTKLLGETVQSRTRHSTQSLAEFSGIHMRTLQRAVYFAGLVNVPSLELVSAQHVFDAEAGEALASRILNSLPTTKLPQFLGCNRTLAQGLVREGHIPRLLPGGEVTCGVLGQVTCVDANQFLEGVFANVTLVTSISEGLTNLVDAAKEARWPVLDIILAVQSGRCRRVEATAFDQGLNGIHVDADEMKVVLTAEQADGDLERSEVASLLGVKPYGVAHLATLLGDDGSLLLRERVAVNAKGVKQYFYSPKDVAIFSASHVHLSTYCNEIHIGVKHVKMALDAQDIEPITPVRSGLSGYIYRRSDLRRFQLPGC